MINNWGRSLGGVSDKQMREVVKQPKKAKTRTHEGRQTLNLYLFSDDKATAPLLTRGLADHGYGVLGTSAQTVDS